MATTRKSNAPKAPRTRKSNAPKAPEQVVRTRAHELGTKARSYGVKVGQVSRTGTLVGSAAVGGFIAGLLGKE